MSTPKYIKDTYKVIKTLSNHGAGFRTPENLRMVQNWGYDQVINAEHYREIGNDEIVSTSYDPVTTEVTVDTNLSSESLDNLRQLTNVAKWGTSITQDSFDKAIVDFIIPETADGTTLKSTLLLPYCFMTGYDLTFPVDGVATESFRFTGNMDEEFLNTYKNISGECLVSGTYGTNTAWTSATARGSNTPVYLYVDGEKYTSGYSWATNTVTLSGIDASGADHVALVYYASGTTYSMISAGATDIAGIKGEDIELWLAYNSTPTSSDKWLRVQNATISVPLDRTEIKELGTDHPIARSLNYPLNIAVTVDLLESDLENYAAEMAGQTFASVNVLNPAMFETRDKLQLKVNIIDPSGTTIENVTVQNLRVDGHGVKLSQGGNATVSWNFTADTIAFAPS